MLSFKYPDDHGVCFIRALISWAESASLWREGLRKTNQNKNSHNNTSPTCVALSFSLFTTSFIIIIIIIFEAVLVSSLYVNPQHIFHLNDLSDTYTSRGQSAPARNTTDQLFKTPQDYF